MNNLQGKNNWEMNKNGILNKNRLPLKKDLEEYQMSLNESLSLQNEDDRDRLARIVKVLVSSCYCFNKVGAKNDARYPLVKNIFNIISKIKDNNLKNFCDNLRPIFDYIDVNRIPNSRAIATLNGSAQKFLYNQKKEKIYPHSFVNDYNRIVFSSAFRRLQDKAQVFSLEEHDYVRTRLTHTIEVSSIASQIANLCSLKIFKDQEQTKKNMAFQMEKVLACAALLHDIGNPPFGHYGEDIIKNFFANNWEIFEYTMYNNNNDILPNRKKLTDSPELHKEDFIKYDGNAQSLRIASTLQVYKPGHSLELTAAVLGAIIKYPVNSKESINDKFGYFYSETKVIEDLKALGVFKDHIRNPFVFILEAADDICYVTSDFDDVVKKHIVTYEDFIFELSQIDTNDNILSNFKFDFEKYYKENRLINVESPFELTIQRMANDLKIRLIQEVVETYCTDEVFHKIIKGVNIIDQINNNNFNCMNNTKCTIELLDTIPSANIVHWLKTNIFVKYVYPSKSIITHELVGHEILNYILKVMCDAVLHLNFNRDDNGNFYLLSKDTKKTYKQFEKAFRLISRNFVEQFKEDTATLDINSFEHIYYRFRLVVDYVSGMTDSYAKEVYQTLKGIK